GSGEGGWFFLSSRRRHTRLVSDWSSDVCSSDLADRLSGPRAAELLAQHPLGRVSLPEEVARAAAFCALDAPAAMTGAILDVNGRSEERRVGEGGRSGRAAEHCDQRRWWQHGRRR